MRRLTACFLFLISVLAGCTEAVPKDNTARILTMGDSMLAWHGGSSNAVSDSVENILGEPVVDRSVIGARVFYNLPISGALGMNISKQYRPSAWEWVIMNGGGNDLWFGCGCRACDTRMKRMISLDGESGSVPDMVRNIRQTGARVIYVGYLRSPGVGSMIEHCRDDGDEYERRLSLMAQSDPGIYFVSLKDLVPHGDRSYHSFDMIHPSVKASRKIGQRIAAIIR